MPPPPVFLQCLGEFSTLFNMWLRIFSNYMLVINATGNAWPEARKRTTLLHCLGAKGQRIFCSLPDTGDTVVTVVTYLEKYFAPKKNVIVERHAFRQRRQAPHETVAQYVAVLRDLASKCGKVEIDPTVKPVRQKLQRLPFSVRASVSAELELC